jgi:hypothetical protein
VLIASPESKYQKKYVHPITAQLIGQGITAGYDKKTLKTYGPGQQNMAEEELDEAGTPDAVRRIEQLVQYK